MWVSALINPHGYPAKLKDAWVAGKFLVVVSPFLLQELEDVLTRPRIRTKYGLDDSTIHEYVYLLAVRGMNVTPPGDLHICRDPDDDIILETALVGGANVAVSRDDDLKRDQDLMLHMKSHGVTVMSVQHFLQWGESFWS